MSPKSDKGKKLLFETRIFGSSADVAGFCKTLLASYLGEQKVRGRNAISFQGFIRKQDLASIDIDLSRPEHLVTIFASPKDCLAIVKHAVSLLSERPEEQLSFVMVATTSDARLTSLPTKKNKKRKAA